MKKRLIILLTSIIIIITAFMILRKCSTKKIENGNIANIGLVAENNGIVYYNKYEKGIFSNKNGKEKQLTEETAYSINIYKDKIYYLTVADFSNVMIKRVDINGENLTTISNINTSISKIFVEDNYIYYLTNKDEKGIARMNLEGQNQELIVSDNIQDFWIYNGEIFYTNNLNQICELKISNKEIKILNDESNAKKIQIVDDWIYYYDENENALFRINKKGKNRELVSVLVKSEIYNVSGKYVYYYDKENYKILRMKIGNSNKCEEIVDVKISKTKINIVKDELYYLDKGETDDRTYQIYRIKTNGKNAQKIVY